MRPCLMLAALLAALLALGARGSQAREPASIYWGAWIGDQFTGEEAPWDAGALAAFEQRAGKRLSILSLSSPFAMCPSGGGCSFYPFPTGAMNRIRRHGALPLFSWGSGSLPVSTQQPNFALSVVANGTYDDYIRSWAHAAARWGHPFFLRFDWEMNGDWFPWSVEANGNSAADYVAAWRRVHDIFKQAGATNATWVWCPNVDPHRRLAPIRPLYPGPDYVDWVCLDGYNDGTPWISFDGLMRQSYLLLTKSVAPGKPVLIGETASEERGGSKPAWIATALGESLATRYPMIHGVVWFEKSEGGRRWPIESSAAAEAAFRKAIASPYFAPNVYAEARISPIPPAVRRS